MAIEKDLLIDKFADLSFGSEQGLGTWLSEQAHPLVLQRLGRLDRELRQGRGSCNGVKSRKACYFFL